jgi:hypothetical protein
VRDQADGALGAILSPRRGEGDEGRRARAVLAASCLAEEPDVSDETASRVLTAFVACLGPQDGRHRCPVTGADRALMELAR